MWKWIFDGFHFNTRPRRLVQLVEPRTSKFIGWFDPNDTLIWLNIGRTTTGSTRFLLFVFVFHFLNIF